MTKILVVDDDVVDREMVRRCLGEIDELEVVEAGNGDEALELMAQEQAEVVLTDLRMPGITGLELVERLAEEHPLAPVILMTSQGNEKIAVEALQAGATSYLPKSDLSDGLVDVVEQALAIVEARRSRRHALRFLTACETRFELDNDPALITPMVAFIEDVLENVGFGTKALRAQVGVCVMEALANAMLHGNLEVDTELRREDRDAFQRQLDERRRSEPYASRRVRCEALESPERVQYTVSDEGPGFDPSTLPDPTDAAHLLAVGGRGIMLMRTIMDEVTFSDGGRRVTMVKHAP
ncbi:MAG: response regulator [Acidobacteriota bacterium]|jgi:CheY-like chemotaxis protein